MGSLGLPNSNVITLIDQKATRENIFQVLNNHLLENSRIHNDDPIIIYYSGYGTAYPTSIFWPQDRRTVEAILPFDRGKIEGDAMVPDIYDFEINDILKKLHAKRSANITVILDCGFHSSAARQPISTSEADTRRTFSLSYSERERSRILCNKYAPMQAKSDVSTHVCIVACEDHERAWERDGMGVLTNTLLNILRQLPLSRTTYQELQQHLRESSDPRQHPRVYGVSEQDFIFRVGQHTSGAAL